MRALSIQQPFAQLIVTGLKRLETRPWCPEYRGTLLIHATANTSMPSSMTQHGNKLLQSIGYNPDRLPRRAIIGSVQLFECYSARQRMLPHVSNLINDDETQLGFWGMSYWTWELTSPVEFDQPIPCKGDISLWRPPARIMAICEQILAIVP